MPTFPFADASVPTPDPAAIWTRQTMHAPPATPRQAAGGGPEQARFAVRVLDNDYNTYQEVIDACRRALGISREEAFAMAAAIDSNGSCVVCEAPWEDACRVASTISAIGIEVRIEPVGAAVTPSS